MLQLLNPGHVELSHSGGLDKAGIGIVVNYWEKTRPLIKELEQTVNFAERKYGDLMQELNLCKEYYEKWATEKPESQIHKRKTRKRTNKKRKRTQSLSEFEREGATGSFAPNEKLKNKFYSNTNEIKDANRILVSNEYLAIDQKSENSNMEAVINNHLTKSEPAMGQSDDVNQKKILSKFSHKRRLVLPRRPGTMQTYKLRSKSLPQGVRRKFGFGSFVETIEKPRPKCFQALGNVKSRTTVLPFSVTKDRTLDRSFEGESTIKCQTPAIQDFESRSWGSNFCIAKTSLENGFLKSGGLSYGKRKSVVTSRQPIPFTICRTTKTFNLGLNIQQVLSLIKSKRHSTMLQTIIKDNIRTAHSVIEKTDSGINALYIAASSGLPGKEFDVCPTRDRGEHCYSVVTSDPESSCNVLACAQTVRTRIVKGNESFPVKLSETQRPEDVWVVEQPNPRQNFQTFQSRCTCFPTRRSVDYRKVLNQYSEMKQCDQQTNSLGSPRFRTETTSTGAELCSLPSRGRINYTSRIEMNKIRDDFDNLFRWYENLEKQMTDQNAEHCEVNAELDAFEVELHSREEDWKSLMHFYSQLMILKKRLGELRERIRSSVNFSRNNCKPCRLRRNPCTPTPSMTLTRVLRQIQCLQDKIKLIDSPSAT